MSEGKVKLPRDLSIATDKELQAYIDAHLPGGEKRRLAEEVKRLRALVPVAKKKAA